MITVTGYWTFWRILSVALPAIVILGFIVLIAACAICTIGYKDEEEDL